MKPMTYRIDNTAGERRAPAGSRIRDLGAQGAQSGILCA